MIKMTRFCDACKKEIKGNEVFYRFTLSKFCGEDKIEFEDVEADFCGKCVTKALNTLRGEEPEKRTKEVEETQPKTRKRKPLDTGKILALHKAGWTYKMIAEEMHCSMSTIYNVLINARCKRKEEDHDLEGSDTEQA